MQDDADQNGRPQYPAGLLSQSLASRALDALSCPLIICDHSRPDNPIIYANPAFEEATGYSPPETMGRNCRFLQGEDTDPLVVREVKAAVQDGRPFRSVILNYGRDGMPFWNELQIAPIRDYQGLVTHVVGIQSDISDRVQAQDALSATTMRLEALINSLQAGVVVEDEGGQVVLSNQTLCDMMGLGVPPSALVGSQMSLFIRHVRSLFVDPERLLARLGNIHSRRRPCQGVEIALIDRRVFELDYSPVFPENGVGYHLWQLRDVTERRQIERQLRDAFVALESQKMEVETQKRELEVQKREMEQVNARLAELATTDGLTGLINQRVFSERLAEEFRRARRYEEPLSLIMLDVDRFKDYNDSFGHLAGNGVLREMARVLREHARETDLVARFGGEEFAVILPHTGVVEAIALAERLRDAIAGADWDARRVVTASLGACSLTHEVDGADALVACADAALYRAKAGGRNRVVHY